jgi:uncharacterized protein
MHSAESAKDVISGAISAGAQPAARHFDPFRLARERGTLGGSFDVDVLERLADRIVGDAGPLAWKVEGGADELGRPALTVAVDGAVLVECQRCLGDFEFPIAHRTTMILARSDAEADALDDASELEVIVAKGPLDTVELVEEELLLWLPFAPVHPDGQCDPE